MIFSQKAENNYYQTMPLQNTQSLVFFNIFFIRIVPLKNTLLQFLHCIYIAQTEKKEGNNHETTLKIICGIRLSNIM
mgnify:FL=1